MPIVQPLVRFGLFELDFGTGELTKYGRNIRLQEQPFRLLRLLLECSGQPVSRDQLKEALWPADTFVDFDHSLNAAVAKLRQALGDSAENPRFIETVARRGYRFIAPVEFIGRAGDEGLAALAAKEPAANQVEKDNSSAATTLNIANPQAGKKIALVACGAATVLLVTLAVLYWRREPLGESELTKLTDDTGFTTAPAVSEDGKLLAYASDRGSEGNLNIWLQQLVPGGTAVKLTNGKADATEPAFSPDNDRIAFTSADKSGGIFVIPVIGGEPTRLTHSGRTPRFSPDGLWIAYGSDDTATPFASGLEGGRIYVVAANGGEPRLVGQDLLAAANPVWSPDGKHLLVYAPPKDGFSWDQADWWLVALDGASSHRTGAFAALKRQGFSLGLGRIPRLSQSNGQFVTFAGGLGDAINSWRMPISRDGHITGPAERLTSGTTSEVTPALTVTGGLVFASLTRNVSIWSVPADSEHAKLTGELKSITDGPAELMPSISTDGRWLAFTAAHRQNGSSKDAIAYSDEGAAELHARIRDLATAKEFAISNSEAVQWHPQISRDGSMVAYTTGKPGSIYTAPVYGGPVRKVTDGTSFFAWDWSRDNRTLLFNTPDQQVHAVDVPTRTQKVFLTRPGFGLFQLRFSPDDKALAVLGCRAECQIYVVPLANGAAPPFKDWIPLDHANGRWDDKPRWSPSGSVMYFLSDRDGFLCIWGQRMDTRSWHPIGAPFPVYHLHKSRLAISNLGTTLTEIGVAKDKIVICLQQLTGNIWSLRRK